ncbi:hypothetical protein LXL04_017439 [Taraxacum kok-saghyz]
MGKTLASPRGGQGFESRRVSIRGGHGLVFGSGFLDSAYYNGQRPGHPGKPILKAITLHIFKPFSLFFLCVSMTMIIRSLIRFGKRHLHTIVSREIIKPSSPTPSHLRTYNLSAIDQMISHAYMPMVAFFPNTSIHLTSHDKTLDLKNSLSQTLTKYYPFAGRFEKVAPSFVDCNDNGAEFLEALIDTTLSDFLQNSHHEDLDQFFPLGLIYFNSDDLEREEVIPLAIQVNHFECGGVAVAVSMTHKIADGSSMVHFINDWAKTTRFCSNNQKKESLIDPIFKSFEYMNMNCKGLSDDLEWKECVTTSFMFPNSMLNELKVKVKAMAAESGEPIPNIPTRVEVLNWHLYNRAVKSASKNKSGLFKFKPTGVYHIANLRRIMIETLDKKNIGNFAISLEILTKNESEMNPGSFINELQTKKLECLGIKNIETVCDFVSNGSLEEQESAFDDMYTCSSMCCFDAYEIDFGWGKPVKVTLGGNCGKNSFILMDAPNMDGIEALVCLETQDMANIERDPEFLACV